MSKLPAKIPLIDIQALRQLRQPEREADVQQVGTQIAAACREYGFFYIKNHGVSAELQSRLEALSRDFFARPEAEKMAIPMTQGGPAWRGYFPVGGELTSGRPDLKEGLYFGEELPPSHPLVAAGTPLHGANQFPAVSGFKQAVLAYVQEMTELGHALMHGVAVSLGLPGSYFYDRYTADPLVLFRIFHYPPDPDPSAQQAHPWGVGEHTDYGLLTILKQDHLGGLQVRVQNEWLEAPYIPDTFVCNIGDMLDRMTAGHYRSTPHRVRNISGQGRLSFPFFFDPHFHAVIQAVPGERPRHDDQATRWDKASVHQFVGTYGDYVLTKVGRVFPELKAQAKIKGA